MKKNTVKKIPRTKNFSRRKLHKSIRPARRVKNKKEVDIDVLDRELPEAYRESVLNEMGPDPSNSIDWTEDQDRGDDLVNNRDPLVQGPERDADNSPELPVVSNFEA